MRFPTREDIVGLNRCHLERSGEDFYEPDNLLNPGSLEWVLEVIQYPLFGTVLYPTLVEKSAILAWTIIASHVFWDGNKRTGMSALETLLILNGYQLNVTDEEIEETAVRVADAIISDYSYEEFVRWLRSKISLRVI